MEEDNLILLGYDQNRSGVLCSVLKLHFKVIANHMEGYLEGCWGKADEESGKRDT